MALGKTPTALLSSATVTGNGSTASPNSLDLSGAIDLAVGFSMTFNSSATAGARIELYADPTGSNSAFSIGSNDQPIDSWVVTGSAGNTVNGAVPMNRSGKYVKVKVVNLSAYSITGVSIYGIVQAQG